MRVKRSADDFRFRRRRLTRFLQQLREVGDLPQQRAVRAARRRVDAVVEVLDLLPLLGDEAAHELQVGLGVRVDVLLDGKAGSTDAASGVLEGTIDDGGGTGVEYWKGREERSWLEASLFPF